MRVGLIGEDPNDTSSIKILLEKNYKSIEFNPLFKHVRGDKLKSDKLIRMLRLEEDKVKEYKIIVVIKDLDGLESEANKLQEVQSWFKKIATSISTDSLLLLNIFELEALLLADPDGLGKYLNCKISYKGNPEFQVNPKEYISKLAKQNGKSFSENDCPKAFHSVDFQKVKEKCASFKRFITRFEAVSGL